MAKRGRPLQASHRVRNGRVQIRVAGRSRTLKGKASDWSEAAIAQEKAGDVAAVLNGTYEERRIGSPRGAVVVPTVEQACAEYLEEKKGLGKERRSKDKPLAPKTLLEIERRLVEIAAFKGFSGVRLNAVTVESLLEYRDTKIQEREDLETLRERRAAGETLTAKERERLASRRGLGNAGINKTIEEFARVIDFAQRKPEVVRAMHNANPARHKLTKLRTEKSRHYPLSPLQATALLDAAAVIDAEKAGRPQERHMQLRLTLWLLIVTGVRISELVGLRRRDVMLQSRKLRVDSSATKTDAAYREIPLADSIIEPLSQWMAASQFTGRDDPLFPSEHGTPRDPVRFGDRVIRPALRLAEDMQDEKGGDAMPSHLRPHDLRRTFARFCFQRRPPIDPATVMRWMGHTSSRLTLDIYVEVSGQPLTAEELEILDWLTGGWT